MGTTANFAIRYPNGTDPICDGWLDIQQMAEDIDAAMDSLDVDINRLIYVPYARVSGFDVFGSDPVSGLDGQFIGFQTVDADYDNLFNLSIDPTSAYPTPGAHWRTGIRWAPTSYNTGNASTMTVLPDVPGTAILPAGTIRASGYDPGPTITYATVVAQTQPVISNFLTANGGTSGASLNLSHTQGATFFVYWTADSP